MHKSYGFRLIFGYWFFIICDRDKPWTGDKNKIFRLYKLTNWIDWRIEIWGWQFTLWIEKAE